MLNAQRVDRLGLAKPHEDQPRRIQAGRRQDVQCLPLGPGEPAGCGGLGQDTLQGRALRDKPGQGGRGRQGCAGGDELDIHSRSLLGIKGHTTPRVRPRAARGGCLAERRMV